jgi:hypothetical protein
MLNELYHLGMTLKENYPEIEIYEWHKDLKPLPNASVKKPCYRICVSADGVVAAIEPMAPQLVVSLRKWERNNGDSFPGLNIHPLYRITDEGGKKLLKKWREGKEAVDVSVLEEWCVAPETKNWDAKISKKISKCLVAIPGELYMLCSDIHADYDAVRTLCQRVIALCREDPDRFYQELKSFIWKSLERGENVRTLLPLLLHDGTSGKKPEDDKGSISVFMDISDWKEYPVAHEKTIKCINEHLLHQANFKSKGVKNGSKDAFGRGAEGREEKLPEVKLPVLAGVKLRSMFSEIPCQRRYGTIDAESYPIGVDSRKLAKGALEWLKDETREGQTWGMVDKKEVLFAYPAAKLRQSLKLASCFGARKRDDTEARFANYAEEVISGLRGIARPLKDIEFRVFSLRKMDKARTKVVFNRNYSAQRLADAAKEWQEGSANVPEIRMKFWGEEKGKVVITGSETPFPLQVSDCLNRVWRQDGTSGSEVTSVTKSSGIELLLDESATTRLVPHLLAIALQNGKALFISLGNTLHRNEVFSLGELNKHKQLMPAILGLLLLKLGIEKENYMNNLPYLVGRMLKLADELHVLYCKEVRGGLPPQLLGNALMVAALDSPAQALAQLALRISPYWGWAQTNSTQSAGLSRYLLKEMGGVGNKLSGLTLPTRFDDAARAQLLLGYISSNVQTENSAK